MRLRLAFDEFNRLIKRAATIGRDHLNLKLAGYVRDVFSLKPPGTDSNVEQNETHIIAVVATTFLNARAVAFTVQGSPIGEDCLQILALKMKGVLKVLYQLGGNLRIIGTACERDIPIVTDDDSDIRAVNFL